MAANGSTISQNSKLSLALVIMLVGALLSAAYGVWAIQSGLETHACNIDIHHGNKDLDGIYVRKDVLTEKFDAIMQRLGRIEKKIDEQ